MCSGAHYPTPRNAAMKAEQFGPGDGLYFPDLARAESRPSGRADVAEFRVDRRERAALGDLALRPLAVDEMHLGGPPEPGLRRRSGRKVVGADRGGDARLGVGAHEKRAVAIALPHFV